MGNFKQPDHVGSFAYKMYPLYYQEYRNRGLSHTDAVRAATLTCTQAAWESDYGRSKIAREQHNYGGYGYNGKTYTTFANDEDFVKAHVALAIKNGMSSAKDLYEYAKIAKEKGYYQDSLEHYSSNLNGMKTWARKLNNFIDQYNTVLDNETQKSQKYEIPTVESITEQNPALQFLKPINKDALIQQMPNYSNQHIPVSNFIKLPSLEELIPTPIKPTFIIN